MARCPPWFSLKCYAVFKLMLGRLCGNVLWGWSTFAFGQMLRIQQIPPFMAHNFIMFTLGSLLSWTKHGSNGFGCSCYPNWSDLDNWVHVSFSVRKLFIQTFWHLLKAAVSLVSSNVMSQGRVARGASRLNKVKA